MDSTQNQSLSATIAYNPSTELVGSHSCTAVTGTPRTTGTILVPVATGNGSKPFDFIRTERKPKIRYEVRRMENGNGSGVREGCELYKKAIAAAQEKGIALDGMHTEVIVTMDEGSGRSFCCRVWAREGY